MKRIQMASVLGLFATCLLVDVVLRHLINQDVAYGITVFILNLVILYNWDNHLPLVLPKK